MGKRLVRSARSDLAWAVAAFATLQLSLAVAMERWWPQLRDPYYGYRAERLVRRTVADDRPLTVVMLGSSRVQNGFDSSALEREARACLRRPVVVFNFGVPGAGPVTNLLNFERLEAAGVRPDLLFVEVVPTMLAGGDSVPAEARYLTVDRLWRRELDLAARYEFPVHEMRLQWWLHWPLPTYQHRFKILSAIAPGLVPGRLRLDWARHVDDSGWAQPINTDPVSALDRGRAADLARREHGSALREFHLGGAPSRALEDLLDRCRARGIATALIWMPEGTDFQGWYSGGVKEAIEHYLADVSRRYQVPLVDARDWVSDEGFLDYHHLVACGARVFTERFGREVLLPTLQARAGDNYHWPLALAIGRPMEHEEAEAPPGDQRAVPWSSTLVPSVRRRPAGSPRR
jgi:hypothetical protein